MIIEEGKFLLYSHITPALKAGDYRFEVTQTMTAKKGTQNIDAGAVPVEPLQTHVTVTAPRYQLPPDQVLSTYPPAGTEGAYGSRLPQIVIKRRTLPWERGLRIPDGHGGETAVAETTPWLALVLIAEGEAELKLNQDVGNCVSSDVHLDGEQDVAKGNCLVVRQSILEKILPSRKDVPLLAHARQVDIHDTELMMGDDDGFLSVVISNRLPVAGVDAQGDPTPVKYLACLINLEGQFHRLIPEAPAPRDHIQLFTDRRALVVQPAVYDHVVSGGLEENWNATGMATSGLVNVAAPHGDALAGDAPLADGPHAAGPHAAGMAIERNLVESAGPTMQAYTAKTGWTQESKHDIYETMADGFRQEIVTNREPRYTFPCLLHWSFVSTGSTTFETLMRELDSGLAGSLPQDPPPPATHKRVPPTGREPLEVVETGHVGLVQRTRRGDSTRSWYRGPLLAHPSSGKRLPIAHASDQLRAVIPDGREDISLAAAFEVGRLLALSKPAMVAALMRWRQAQFQAARSAALWEDIVDQLPFELDGPDVRTMLESKLRSLITTDPEQFIGAHRPLVTPGDPVDWGASPLTVLARGLGLEVDLGRQLREVGDFAGVTGTLRTTEPPVMGRLGERGVVNAGDLRDVAHVPRHRHRADGQQRAGERDRHRPQVGRRGDPHARHRHRRDTGDRQPIHRRSIHRHPVHRHRVHQPIDHHDDRHRDPQRPARRRPGRRVRPRRPRCADPPHRAPSRDRHTDRHTDWHTDWDDGRATAPAALEGDHRRRPARRAAAPAPRRAQQPSHVQQEERLMKVDMATMYESLPLQMVTLVPPAMIADTDDLDSAMPAEMRNWLVRLRLLEGVPFANLVADTELLPEESIRWFYLDRQWTDALVQGALSVGTVNSDDRTHLAAAYPAIQDELDNEERNVRRRAGTARFGGKVDAISGFVLRSAAVAGWPGLHVRAFKVEPTEGNNARYPEDHPNRMRLLRLERLAPAVLLCLFDGIPKMVHIEEPRQGVQFGFDTDAHDDTKRVLKPRDKSNFKDLVRDPVPVPFRSGSGSPGVVDIQQLERRLAAIPQTGAGDGLDSGEYALQLVRFPYRQIWGDDDGIEISDAFVATLSYTRLVATFKGVH